MKMKMKMMMMKRPHFFKIIMPGITTHQLRIPPNFIKHILKEESGTAILEGPSGHHWNVELRRTADGTFVQDGWQHFIRDHCLGNNEFLVFRYDGNMCFNVKIFDKTGCERPDLFTNETHEEFCISTGGKKGGRPSKKSVQAPCKRHGVPPKKFVGSSLKRRGRPLPQFVDSTHLCQSKACKRKSGMNGVAQERTKTGDFSVSIQKNYSEIQDSLSTRRPPSETEMAKAWKSAMNFSSNLPYFMRSLSKSSVSVSYVLKIPTGFATTHFPSCKTEIVLLNQSGNTWIVNFVPGNTNSFCGGWTAFARENKLQEGDICIFELVGEFQMHVHIVRAVKQVTFSS